MPSGALGDRLSRLPGVAECTFGGEGVRLVATPGTDLRLLRARAQAVCADAGERRALTVVLAPTVGGGPWVVRPQSAILTRIGGSRAVAVASILALGLIATLPGEDKGQLAPLAAPAPLAVSAEQGPPAGAGGVLVLALRRGDDGGPGRAAGDAAAPDPAPGLSLALATPASVQVSGAGRRTVSPPAPASDAPAEPVAATPTQLAPAVSTTTTTVPKAKNVTRGKAHAASSSATATQSADAARPATVATHGQGHDDGDDEGHNGAHGKGHDEDD